MILDFSSNQKLIGIVPIDELPPFHELLRLAARVQRLRWCCAQLTNIGTGIVLHLEGDLNQRDIDLAVDAFGDFLGESSWLGKPT